MRNYLIATICIFLICGYAYSQPLTLEQVGNVLESGQLEIGIDASYSQDITIFADTDPEQKLTLTMTVIPLFARYALNDNIEITAWIPASMQMTMNFEVGGTPISGFPMEQSGMGDSTLGMNYTLGENMACGVELGLPTGEEDMRGGLALMPFYLYKLTFGDIISNLGIGYGYTGEYGDDEKTDPQDRLLVGVEVEKPMKENISIIGELTYRSLLNNTKIDSVEQADTTGSMMDVILGGRANFGSLKTKLGVAVSFGEEKTRQYDYMVFLGLSYIL